ncbi:MAG: hypothetical protein LQ345_001070 [Seirophora villosa]|nr:MAG: hypothetical protein LQ345_001070 [Seirophora villosa]
MVMDFVTVGMFIIDEIHYQPPKKSDFNVMGGAGLYAALGARLFRPPPSSYEVGWIVHEGHDFPSHIKATIDAWETSCRFVPTFYRPTTRAWNAYEPGGFRSFRYTNEKIRIDEDCLTSEQLQSKTHHLICSADRCISLARGIDRKRRELAEADRDGGQSSLAPKEKPFFIWEPLPDLCKPSEMGKFQEALKLVDVASPNLDEFCSLLGVVIDLDRRSGWSLLRQVCAELIETKAPEVVLVIRLGRKGCFVAQADNQFRLPAYHDELLANHVVDPTGGGNTFLGAFAVGLLEAGESSRGGRFEQAAVHGIVAASFAIEQVGVPILKRLASKEELWNGDRVGDRLEKYRERLAMQVSLDEDY